MIYDILSVAAGGLLGGFMGYCCRTVKQAIDNRMMIKRIVEVEEDMEDFRGKMHIKYNALSRTVKHVLVEYDSDDPKDHPGERPSADFDIPDELKMMANAAGLDLEALLKGDQKQISTLKGMLSGNKQNNTLIPEGGDIGFL